MAPSHDSAHPPRSAALGWLEAHGDALYAFALARVRDPDAAEDLVQETLLSALGSAEQFLGRSAERTWLIGILRHKLVDQLRRSLRERPVGDVAEDGMAELFDDRGHWRACPSRWSADPRELAESAEFREVLARCLARLPARMAQLFWLRESEGMETSELCEQLAVSPANLWTLLHRARCGLRRCLTLHWFDGDA